MLSSAIPPVLLALAGPVPLAVLPVPGPQDATQEVATLAPSEPELHLAGRGGGASSPGEAADQARRQTGGGQVLSVRRTNGGYEVKVLTPGGEVRMVFVPGSGS